jgi:hypothetical protein
LGSSHASTANAPQIDGSAGGEVQAVITSTNDHLQNASNCGEDFVRLTALLRQVMGRPSGREIAEPTGWLHKATTRHAHQGQCV